MLNVDVLWRDYISFHSLTAQSMTTVMSNLHTRLIECIRRWHGGGGRGGGGCGSGSGGVSRDGLHDGCTGGVSGGVSGVGSGVEWWRIRFA